MLVQGLPHSGRSRKHLIRMRPMFGGQKVLGVRTHDFAVRFGIAHPARRRPLTKIVLRGVAAWVDAQDHAAMRSVRRSIDMAMQASGAKTDQ
jgi:hypothetical protein